MMIHSNLVLSSSSGVNLSYSLSIISNWSPLYKYSSEGFSLTSKVTSHNESIINNSHFLTLWWMIIINYNEKTASIWSSAYFHHTFFFFKHLQAVVPKSCANIVSTYHSHEITWQFQRKNNTKKNEHKPNCNAREKCWTYSVCDQKNENYNLTNKTPWKITSPFYSKQTKKNVYNCYR